VRLGLCSPILGLWRFCSSGSSRKAGM